MNLQDVAKIRFANQQIGSSTSKTPKDLVGWMGALQAQDYEMAKWAMGIRLPGSTLETIEAAIERGDIIRTHLLRPTWHVVSAHDLRWLLELTRPQIMTAMRTRHKYLGLTEKAIARSDFIIAEALTGGKHLVRKKLVGVLENAGFQNNDNRASHLLLRAELDGVICSGASKGKNYTYALMDERVPDSPQPNKEEALYRLAEIYFRSHGPATLEDFVWWSGLKITDARRALEMAKPDLSSEEIESQEYWFTDKIPMMESNSVHLLPAYDEFIISYKDRSAVIPEEDQAKAISTNGIFRPVIVHDGQVIGIWKRSIRKQVVVVETVFFNNPTKATLALVEEAAGRFATFLDRKCELSRNLK